MAFIALVSLFASLVAAGILPTQTFTIPLPTINGSSPLVSQVGYVAFDGNYVTQPNATSYEWWYFDAFSSDLSASVVFHPSVTYSDKEPLLLRFSLSLNETVQEFSIPKEKLNVSAIGQGSAGIASDGSFSWESTPDLSEYKITLDLEEIGVTGEISLKSVAPPHVACSAAYPGARLDYHWDLFWANAIPDSVASVNLVVNGTAIAFEGNGYHDKNWGPFSFIPNLNQWYWGHGRAGEYSVVWFYHIDAGGGVSSSAYIVKRGKILYSDCGEDIVVRPYGPGVVYPIPSNSSARPEGVTINVNAGALGQFTFTSTQKRTVAGSRGYSRWIGEFVGGLKGDVNSTGIALWEQMGPFPTNLVI